MCAIVGFYPKTPGKHQELLINLIRESKIRGLHAFGVSYFDGMIRTERSLEPLSEELIKRVSKYPMIYHARYSTSGDWKDEKNNQPIHTEISVVMNGVISMKPKREYEQEFGVKCETENDTEIFNRIVEKGVDPTKFSSEIRGSMAVCYIHNGDVYALRNSRRPLHLFEFEGADFAVSTIDIARRAGFTGEIRNAIPNKLYRLGCL